MKICIISFCISYSNSNFHYCKFTRQIILERSVVNMRAYWKTNPKTDLPNSNPYCPHELQVTNPGPKFVLDLGFNVEDPKSGSQ